MITPVEAHDFRDTIGKAEEKCLRMGGQGNFVEANVRSRGKVKGVEGVFMTRSAKKVQ